MTNLRSLALAGVALGAVAAGLPIPMAWAQEASDLTLSRVMLSTGGVGYFEFEAQVTGDAELTLDVRLDQVDDVLKSLVVYDDSGAIGTVSLPGREPLREVFRELPFSPDALAAPEALLNALRGAEVRAIGAREVVGRILSVTAEDLVHPTTGLSSRQHRVTLMTDDGMRQVILEETDALSFVDPDLQAQIAGALEALAQHNERDRRELTVQSLGDGQRTIRVAYVVEVPLWKSSYRLTLSDDPAVELASLQGWAVLENLSGDDWDGIELTVVSGNPVTFTQALYQAYYVDRPEVPVEVFGRVMPSVDTGAIPLPGQQPMPAPAPADFAARAPVAESAMIGALAGSAIGGGYMDAEDRAMEQAEMVAAESTEATSQVMFRFPTPITVENGHSLLVPMIAREVPAERLSLYQPETHALHPLSTVRLENDSESGLPPGILTLFEQAVADGRVAYVGDAQIGAFPAGEDRLISFAVDQRVRVDRESSGGQTITEGSIVDGILRLTLTDEQTTTYTITGAAREDRLVALEHPRQAGWDLVVDPALRVEETENRYRIYRDVPAGEVVEVPVTLRRPRFERVSLVDMSDGQIQYYTAAARLSDSVRAAVAELATYRSAIVDAETALRTLENERRAIVDDQARVRRNLDSVPRDSDLYQRYLQTLSEQEDRLEGLNQEIDTAQTDVTAARQALIDYARTLTL